MKTSSAVISIAGLWIGDIELSQGVVHAGQIIFRIVGERLRGFLAKAVEEIGQIQKTLAIVTSKIRGGAIHPGIQLQVGVLDIDPVCAADIILVQECAHLGKALIHPGDIVAVGCILDHVHKFVRECGIGILIAQVLGGAQHISFMGIGVFLNLGLYASDEL